MKESMSSSPNSFADKSAQIKKKFFLLPKDEDKYLKIIDMGQKLPSFESRFKIDKHIVSGCQSLLYLHADLLEEKIYFSAFSESLISAGLAALLFFVYNGELPEVILKHPPDFIQEVGIAASLSPNRSNGLAHIYLRMKQEALKAIAYRP